MIIIGEKINGAIPGVEKAIAERDAGWIRDLARRQDAAGADYIDVCASVDDNETEVMRWPIGLVQEVTEKPICIDSPDPRVCVDCIPFCNKPGIVNSISLEGNKPEVILPAIADSGWGVVALATEPESLLGFNEAVRLITGEYPGIHITSGLSNISFGLPARKYINQAFMVLARMAGMDSAIVDPTNRDMMGLIYAMRLSWARTSTAWSISQPTGRNSSERRQSSDRKGNTHTILVRGYLKTLILLNLIGRTLPCQSWMKSQPQ